MASVSKGKAQVSNVVKQLADLGAEGATEIKGNDFEGVLPKDLAPLITAESTCRLKVFKKLENKLLQVAPESVISSENQFLDAQGVFGIINFANSPYLTSFRGRDY
jgi:hypothetical protein